jgi:hypothetical protein
MARYANTKIEKTNNNKTTYNTTIYKDIPKRDDDIVVITQDGDRLDLLANQFYQNQSLWWYIAQANNLNTMSVQPGVTLRIPATTEFAKGK